MTNNLEEFDWVSATVSCESVTVLEDLQALVRADVDRARKAGCPASIEPHSGTEFLATGRHGGVLYTAKGREIVVISVGGVNLEEKFRGRPALLDSGECAIVRNDATIFKLWQLNRWVLSPLFFGDGSKASRPESQVSS